MNIYHPPKNKSKKEREKNMNKENTKRTNWEVKEQYSFNYKNHILKIPNRKKSVRYGHTDRDDRIAKYGMNNYLAYSEEIVA